MDHIKKVTLVTPIFNEKDHLGVFLEKIDALDLEPFDKELIFIDDQSTDGSDDILRQYQFKSKVKRYFQGENKGKGYCLRKGFKEASGDVIGIQDADFEYDMQDVLTLIKPITEGKADVVFGSRFKKNNQQVHRTYHYLINRFLTLLSNICSGLYLTDMETCYKFFDSKVIKNINLESDRFGFEPEITAKIAKKRLKILEFPINYYPRTYLQGKKITWKDGIAALRHIIYYNFFCK